LSVENPAALKGHEGHHVQVKGHVDADKGSIHITEVKMLKGDATKKGEMKKSGSSFRKPGGEQAALFLRSTVTGRLRLPTRAT